ncbi:tetratricopeptide repeat protein [Paracoccus luteus]|uniref:tetratricopeptide repeat protein n=1 Tax=Paracoccus luteus TaxID=2508543 RepID=UPI00106FE4AC|nr:tetratricopeptide repeat protein [Paracoccus luteus]
MPFQTPLTATLAALLLTGPAAAQQPPLPRPAQFAPQGIAQPAPHGVAQPAPQGVAQDAPARAGATQTDAARTDAVPVDPSAPRPPLDPIPGLAGPYLAARQAAGDSDFVAAARYFREAVERDPSDPFLQDSAVLSLVAAGEFPAATALAQSMQAGGRATELSLLVRRADLARQGDWAGLLALLDSAPSANVGGGELVDGMMRGWALMGAGRASDAFAAFDALTDVRGAGPIARFQLALAKASVGDYEAAEVALRDPEASSHLLGIQARAQILSQLERNADALALLDGLEAMTTEPLLVDLRARLQAGERLPFTAVRSPADGIAQVLLTFAGALMGGDEPEPLSLVYARLAQYLSPDLTEARLMTAQILQTVGQFDLAEVEFAALREGGQMRPVAELARIEALSRADRLDDAEAAARALTEARPDLAGAWVALGDLLRQRDRFADAVPVYDRALAILQKDADPQASWFALYARGMALERSGQFDRADADFQAALALQPEQAPILNYLGYSWVDRNVRLDEGLELIRKAVELRPDDGYILDSLAWAYYRLGRYDEAVAPMERAVSAMSDDSLVNDHMGDIYWMVGRKREAEIQWRRAQSLHTPADTDTDLNRVRAKLNVGLDAVLAAEKANGGTLPQGFGQPEETAAPDDDAGGGDDAAGDGEGDGDAARDGSAAGAGDGNAADDGAAPDGASDAPQDGGAGSDNPDAAPPRP